MKVFNSTLLFATSLFLLMSCAEKREKKQETAGAQKEIPSSNPTYDVNHPKTILTAVAKASGGWNNLWKKKDVQYTYDYRYADGKADISTERYIFDSEASYGKYQKHEINVMPDQEGIVIQYFNGNETIVEVDGKKMDAPELISASDFLRKANYYWFTMPYKLDSKAVIAKYLGQEEYNGIQYDKVEVSYDPAITGKEQNDMYIIYVNPETKLIDRFYFSLPFLGVNEPVIIANYYYENVKGLMISTKRTYFMPSENGYSEEPNLVQTLTDITFDNNFTLENIME